MQKSLFVWSFNHGAFSSFCASQRKNVCTNFDVFHFFYCCKSFCRNCRLNHRLSQSVFFRPALDVSCASFRWVKICYIVLYDTPANSATSTVNSFEHWNASTVLLSANRPRLYFDPSYNMQMLQLWRIFTITNYLQ